MSICGPWAMTCSMWGTHSERYKNRSPLSPQLPGRSYGISAGRTHRQHGLRSGPRLPVTEAHFHMRAAKKPRATFLHPAHPHRVKALPQVQQVKDTEAPLPSLTQRAQVHVQRGQPRRLDCFPIQSTTRKQGVCLRKGSNHPYSQLQSCDSEILPSGRGNREIKSQMSASASLFSMALGFPREGSSVSFLGYIHLVPVFWVQGWREMRVPWFGMWASSGLHPHATECLQRLDYSLCGQGGLGGTLTVLLPTTSTSNNAHLQLFSTSPPL